jgi:hypothetical protein
LRKKTRAFDSAKTKPNKPKSKPIKPNLYCIYSCPFVVKFKTNPNKANLVPSEVEGSIISMALIAGKIVPSMVEGPIKTTPGLAGLNQQATRDYRPATKQRFVLTFAGNFFKFLF